MKNAAQISAIADQLKAVSDRLVQAEFLRSEGITKIKENTRLSDSAKQEELAKVSGLEVLTALRAQVKILAADLETAKGDWDKLSTVLRAAALPLGGTPAESQVFSMLRDEAQALENDPKALQAALEAAAVTKDWPRLYALCLGRCDENGRPLDRWKGVIQGIRLDCCDLPGQLAVMEAVFRGQDAILRAEAAWSHATGQRGTTTQALLSNLPARLAEAKYARQNRMMLTPAEALQRDEDARTDTRDRYEAIGDQGSLFAFFDNATGQTRFVDQKTGPAYMAELNALTRIPKVSDVLAETGPINDEVNPGQVGH